MILKMKEPPGMSMKTQAMTTKCPAKNMAISGEFTHGAVIDNHLSRLLAKDAQVSR
jgi:hypothetical protein